MRWRAALVRLGVVAAAVGVAGAAMCCPFCSAVKQTFCEEIAANDVAVLAKLVVRPERPAGNVSPLDAAPAANMSQFEVVEALRGEEVLSGEKRIQALYFGDQPLGTVFLLMGLAGDTISWSTPVVMSERSQAYLHEALQLPPAGADRLVFFQDYLQDAEEMIAGDAYDEFAKAPFADLKTLAPHMHRERIVDWTKNPQVTPSKRRLFLTMLSVCGRPDDADFLQAMIESKDREAHKALDALIAAYLTLKGADGLPLIDDLFLKNQDAEYTETWAAIMAVRFHGQEEKIIPRSRLTESLRYMLDRPKLADTVVNDLARWEDWTVMDRLVELFKKPDEDLTFIRVPVVNYLRVCPLPKAKEYLAELAKIDPKSVKQAETFFPQLKPADPNAAQRPTEAKPGTSGKSAQAGPNSARGAAPAAGAANGAVAVAAKPAGGKSSAARPTAAIVGPHVLADSAAEAPSRWQLAGILATASVGLWVVFTLLLGGGRRAAT